MEAFSTRRARFVKSTTFRRRCASVFMSGRADQRFNHNASGYWKGNHRQPHHSLAGGKSALRSLRLRKHSPPMQLSRVCGPKRKSAGLSRAYEDRCESVADFGLASHASVKMSETR